MRVILTALLATIALSAQAADPQFVRIQPDQSSYTVGSKAVLIAHIDRLPTESTKEFFVDLKMNGEAMNVIQVSNRMAVALPNRFSTAGLMRVESSIYLQDKAEQLQLRQSAAYYKKQVDSLLKKIEEEVDPDYRQLLETHLAKTRIKLSIVESQIEANRTLVEVGVSQFSVSPTGKAGIDSVFSLVADRDPASYNVGERAIFTATPETGFTGPDGPRELLFKGKIGDQGIPYTAQNGIYNFSSPIFSSDDVGSKIFEATLLIHSKDQADLLRNARSNTIFEKRKLEKELSESIVVEEKIYLEARIQDMARVIVAIEAQLEEILLEVDTRSLEFSVTN